MIYLVHIYVHFSTKCFKSNVICLSKYIGGFNMLGIFREFFQKTSNQSHLKSTIITPQIIKNEGYGFEMSF